jgi:hypothetical protein
MQPTQALLALLCIRSAAPLSTTTEQLRAAHRSERLNLLNHPLQIQLATGALPYGSFVRLCHDRDIILEAVRSAAAAAGADVLAAEVSEAQETKKAWLETAEAAGKTISTGDPSIKCYACGGDHLNVDCPDDLTVTGPARAVAAVLRSYGGAEAATGVLAVCEYGWACDTLLKAGFETPYAGWLRAHADSLNAAAAAVIPLVDAADRDAVDASYVAALSALFNFVDSEASTAGLKGTGEDLEAARRKLDALEPGFLEAQDRNANFVSATLKAQAAKSSAGAKKMDAAAAYLAAKKAKAGG